MAGLNRLLAVAIIVHVALFGATIFIQNGTVDVPYYGGDHGFLPSTGDDAGAYDQFSSWLAGGSRQQLDEPGDGVIGLLKWIIPGPLCGIVNIVKFLISIGILKYGIIDSIPSEGFGLWFKTAVHLAATLIHVGLISMLLGFAVRAGVFSNVYLLGALGIISVLGIVATVLDLGGAFSCG